jgi:hypothetical protein
MPDDWIPFAALAFIGLFGFAMVHEGRKQRRQKIRKYKAFASQKALRYLAKDDGTAQAFAGDFDAIGRFRSSSLGEVIPEDVVSGTAAGTWCILFRHYIRWSEGDSREWFVAGVKADEPLAQRCAVQFCAKRTQRSTPYLVDPAVKEENVGEYDLVVRAPAPADAGRMMEEDFLRHLGRLAGELPFRPEIQVRGDRVIAYLADRNATLEDGTLADLFEFARRVASVQPAQ